MTRLRTPAHVLAEWRAALARLARAPVGSAEDASLRAEVEGLRAEYQRRVDEALQSDTPADVDPSPARPEAHGKNRRADRPGGSGTRSTAA